jgi:hypothetical protein
MALFDFIGKFKLFLFDIIGKLWYILFDFIGKMLKLRIAWVDFEKPPHSKLPQDRPYGSS